MNLGLLTEQEFNELNLGKLIDVKQILYQIFKKNEHIYQVKRFYDREKDSYEYLILEVKK